MSSQTRIDHYFKSTSGTHKDVKVLTRPQPSHKLKTGPRRSRSLRHSSSATHVGEKTTRHTKHSTQEASTDDVVYLGSIHKSPADTSIKQDQSNAENDFSSSVNVTTPVKKTIRGFAKACNSPLVNFHDSPTMSRTLTNSPVHHKNNVIGVSKVHLTNTTNLPVLPASRNSCNLSEYSDKISADDVVEVTDVNSYKPHSQQSNVQRGVRTCNEELKNNNNPMETGEDESNSQRNNIAVDSQSRHKDIKTSPTPKKRKMGDLSSPKKSPSSRWRVAVSIETADVSMTALSSDWQKTLEASQELKKSSMIAEQGESKENVEAISDKESNDENLSEKSTCARDNRCNNAYPKKTSPRRALFSPRNSAKRVCFEESSKPNEHCTSTTKINGRSNSTKKVEGPLENGREQNKSSDFCTNVNEDANLLTQVSYDVNSPTKLVGASSSPKNITHRLQTPTKHSGTATSPLKVNAARSMQRNVTNSPTTPTKPAILTVNRNEHLTTPTKSPFKTSKSSFSPRFKVSPQKPRKERVDTGLATKAVENLNQAKQGIIPMNDFDLEMIYTKKSFDFEYGSLKTNTAIKYEAKDVQVPEEKHADHFFMVLVNVFSEALNCGYFNEEELDTVFSTLTLSPDAQSLLARMLKRKRGWHRVNSIKYPEIADDLTPVCQELVVNGFLDDDIANEDISKLLNVLQVDEIKAVCQAMKRPKAAKPAMILDLVKLANKNTSLFPGMKSPGFALRKKIDAVLGMCIRLPDRIESLLNRILVLLIPNQDPKENMADAFRMLIQVHFDEKRFPETPKERFPIFRNRLHLIRVKSPKRLKTKEVGIVQLIKFIENSYAEAKSAYTQIINASEAKDWDAVRTLGQLAHDNLRPYFESSDNGDMIQCLKIPSHVKRYDPNYLWIKVMSKSVEGFKKTKEGMAIAAEFLHTLVNPRNKIPANRTRWYNELAMIESYHRKNFELSAEITLMALTQEKISDMDAAHIFERARKLCKSKAISTNTKDRINAAISLRQELFVSTSEPTVKEIEATMIPGNITGSKSTWSVNIGGADTGYVRVENVALRYYLSEGFRTGIHCEGALPVTLFATLLWEEIYTVPVPGAFVSPYQQAPLDLYTSHFLEPRRERIENKLDFIRRLDLDSLSSMMHEDFIKYREYESLVHGNLLADPDDFKDFIECLGIDAVVGICERLAGNYTQWKSGFPDLTLWNPDTKKCKIVEVKGPGDSLSIKQKMWIQFLETLGVDVEVCVVKGTTKRYAT